MCLLLLLNEIVSIWQLHPVEFSCLLDMSISKRGVLKLSIMIMGLSISPYSSISQFDALLLGPYLLKLLCFLGN